MATLAVPSFAFRHAEEADSVKPSRVLRTAFIRARSFEKMDTCRIEQIDDYHILEALYSPLVQYSNLDGQLYASAASSYRFSPGWIHFHLRDDIVTLDGYKVTAEDAAFSIKRLLICNSNMHGNASQFLDVNPISNINESVEGIKTDGQTLSIKIKGVPALVLSFLSSIDFAIIPKIAVDLNTLEIVEKRNTTGPYYLSTSTKDFLFSLHANKNHWSLRRNSPETINVLPVHSETDISDLFEKDEIDFIGQTLEVAHETKLNLQKSVDPSRSPRIHTTEPLFVMTMAFSKKGMELQANQRLKLLVAVQNFFNKNRLHELNKNGQFFSASPNLLLDSSFGTLRGDLLDKCAEMRASTQDVEWPKRKIRIAMHPNVVAEYKKSYSELSEIIDFESMDVSKSFADLREGDFDLFQVGFDVSDKEDTTSIAMLFHLGFFEETDSTPFVPKYLQEENEKKREAMLQKLHFNAVCASPTLIPLSKMKMVSVTQNGWIIPIPGRIIGVPYFDIELNETEKK